ncbi:hypothetical protein KAR91_60905 [Candidatus Pacearchaeota archaeon]|nr:hypothetical protein [Candidatus Pacearchaeota archaeon]
MITKMVSNSLLYRVLVSVLALLLVSSVLVGHYKKHKCGCFLTKKTDRTSHVRPGHLALVSGLKSRMTGHTNVRFVRFVKSILVYGLKSRHCAYIHRYANKRLMNAVNWPGAHTKAEKGPSWKIWLTTVGKGKKSANFWAKNRCPVGANCDELIW